MGAATPRPISVGQRHGGAGQNPLISCSRGLQAIDSRNGGMAVLFALAGSATRKVERQRRPTITTQAVWLTLRINFDALARR